MRNRVLNLMWIGALLCLVSGIASAQGPGAVRKQVEGSMLLKGGIEIGVDGSVAQVTLERENDIPPGIVSFVRVAAMQWKFEPILKDDAPVAARAPMSVRLVANKLDDGDYEVRIASASFDQYDPGDQTTVRFQKQTPPSYPADALRARVAGDVYALIKVGRDGRVLEAVAEQVNLKAVTSERGMKKWRDVFSRTSVKALKEWTFHVPTEGAAADRPYWVVRVPVRFRLGNSSKTQEDHYGKWESYIPGPLASIPWRDAQQTDTRSPDALPDGGVYMDGEGRGPRLLTPLDKG